MNVELIDYRPSPYITYYTFAIEGISRACSHQLAHHKVTSFSQESQRYINMDGFGYVTPESFTTTVTDDYWNTESGDNSTLACEEFDSLMEYIGELYERMIRAGVPEDDARYILPNACCVDVTVTMATHELRDFLSCCYRAGTRREIRQVAERMREFVREVASDESMMVVE